LASYESSLFPDVCRGRASPMQTETNLCFQVTDSPADLGATPTAYLPFFSARGCTQTLTLLNAPSLRRTVNGRLVSFSNPLLKYTSVISCQDKSPLACDELWVAAALRVDCIQYLACAVAREVNRLTLGRELVDGSGILQDTRGNEYPLQQIGAKEVIYSPLSEGGFLHYPPPIKNAFGGLSAENR